MSPEINVTLTGQGHIQKLTWGLCFFQMLKLEERTYLSRTRMNMLPSELPTKGVSLLCCANPWLGGVFS